jgi:hypothetical protein
MTILELINDTSELSLTSDEQSALVAAYESALFSLGLTEHDQVLAAMIANRIIAIARSGERDPHRLRDAAIASLGTSANPDT